MTQDSNPPIDWKADSQSFDSVAELYDLYRPSYPAELVEDILHYSGIQPEGKILEIGSGTGKATQLFAPRGYNLLCLEPGQNLIDIAAKKFAAYPNVRFVKARFEEWVAEPASFDLVTSAQAFHWVPENVRFEKTALVLKPQGTLALFWNLYPGMMEEIRQELDQVYLQFVPEIAKPGPTFEQVIEGRAESLRESPYYENVVVKRYPWSVRYETNAYLGLLNTYSDHLRLPEEKRRLLFEKIGEIIDRHGASIERPYLGVLFLARKRAV